MRLDTDKYLATRDLYFASYLFAKGYELSTIKPDNGGVFSWFIFSEKRKCEQEEQSFQKKEALINAKDYSEAIKYLKRKVSQ